MSSQQLIPSIIREASALSWVDWVVTITALIYVVLAARENIWCWFWGIISCSLWAYATFSFYQLYLDAGLQLFYVVMGFIGIYRWKYGSKDKRALSISRLSLKRHVFIIASGSVLALVFGYLFGTYTPAAANYLDAFTTIFAIIATIILVQKVLDNWLYWIVVDGFYIYLYISRGAYLFALLMLIYVIIAIAGFYRWRRSYLDIV